MRLFSWIIKRINLYFDENILNYKDSEYRALSFILTSKVVTINFTKKKRIFKTFVVYIKNTRMDKVFGHLI